MFAERARDRNANIAALAGLRSIAANLIPTKGGSVLVSLNDVTEVVDRRDSVAMRVMVRASQHGTDVSLTWVRLSGRHRPLRTDRSTRLYYVLDGSATFTVGATPPFEARRDDVVVVPRGMPYELQGEMTYLVINGPAFVDGDDIYEDAGS